MMLGKVDPREKQMGREGDRTASGLHRRRMITIPFTHSTGPSSHSLESVINLRSKAKRMEV